MRKFLAVLTVLALGFVLVACGGSANKSDLFVSPNKIVYTQEEVTGGKPVVSADDFEVYAILDNRSAVLVDNAEVVSTIDLLSDNIYKVTVSYSGYTSTYNIYLINDAAPDMEAVAVQALSTSYGIEDEGIKLQNVMKLYWTTIMREVDLEGISVLTATFGAETMDDVTSEPAVNYFEAAKPVGYAENIKKMEALNVLTFKFQDAKETTIVVKNHTVKPANDNQLPISIDMENNFL